MLKDVDILLRVRPRDLPEPALGWDALLDKITKRDIMPEIKHVLALFGYDIISEHIKIEEGPRE